MRHLWHMAEAIEVVVKAFLHVSTCNIFFFMCAKIDQNLYILKVIIHHRKNTDCVCSMELYLTNMPCESKGNECNPWGILKTLMPEELRILSFEIKH